jgi:tetratricopeptide (TPR) repeat protein
MYAQSLIITNNNNNKKPNNIQLIIKKYKNKMLFNFIFILFVLFVLANIIGWQRSEQVFHSLLTRIWLIWRRLINGKDTMILARDLNDRGLKLQKKGDIHGAIECFSQAIEIGKATVGVEDPDVTQWLITYGFALHSTADYKDAFAIFHQVLEIRIDTLGEHHPLVAEWIDNMVTAYMVVGEPECDYKAVEKLAAKSLEIKILCKGGELFPEIAQALNDYAFVVVMAADTGDTKAFARAREIGMKAAKIFEQTLGISHEKTQKAISDWSGVT